MGFRKNTHPDNINRSLSPLWFVQRFKGSNCYPAYLTGYNSLSGKKYFNTTSKFRPYP